MKAPKAQPVKLPANDVQKPRLGRIMSAPVTALRDPRADMMRDYGHDPEGGDVLQGMFPDLDTTKLSHIQRARAEIRSSWAGAGHAFIQIGRALRAIDACLDDDEQRLLRARTAELFPFQDGVATQLKLVARAVDQGRIPEDRCPATYSVAYRLVRLDDAMLRTADERGLVRVDVTRVELDRFVTEERLGAPRGRKGGASPEVRRARLLARRQVIWREMQAIDRVLRQLGDGEVAEPE